MEAWSYRPGCDPQEQLKELERTLGLQNLKDVSIQEVGATKVLQILTGTKKYQVTLTEV